MHTLRDDYGLKIGSTTGFVRSMVDIVLEESTKAGYIPDVTVAADEVPQVHNLWSRRRCGYIYPHYCFDDATLYTVVIVPKCKVAYMGCLL